MNTKKVLETLLISECLGINDLAKLTGVHPQIFRDIQAGKIAKLSPKVCAKIVAALPSISPQWLRTGTGDMYTHAPAHVSQNVNNSTAQTIAQTCTPPPPSPCKDCEELKRLTDVITQQAQTIAQLVECVKKSK